MGLGPRQSLGAERSRAPRRRRCTRAAGGGPTPLPASSIRVAPPRARKSSTFAAVADRGHAGRQVDRPPTRPARSGACMSHSPGTSRRPGRRPPSARPPAPSPCRAAPAAAILPPVDHQPPRRRTGGAPGAVDQPRVGRRPPGRCRHRTCRPARRVSAEPRQAPSSAGAREETPRAGSPKAAPGRLEVVELGVDPGHRPRPAASRRATPSPCPQPQPADREPLQGCAATPSLSVTGSSRRGARSRSSRAGNTGRLAGFAVRRPVAQQPPGSGRTGAYAEPTKKPRRRPRRCGTGRAGWIVSLPPSTTTRSSTVNSPRRVAPDLEPHRARRPCRAPGHARQRHRGPAIGGTRTPSGGLAAIVDRVLGPDPVSELVQRESAGAAADSASAIAAANQQARMHPVTAAARNLRTLPRGYSTAPDPDPPVAHPGHLAAGCRRRTRSSLPLEPQAPAPGLGLVAPARPAFEPFLRESGAEQVVLPEVRHRPQLGATAPGSRTPRSAPSTRNGSTPAGDPASGPNPIVAPDLQVVAGGTPPGPNPRLMS